MIRWKDSWRDWFVADDLDGGGSPGGFGFVGAKQDSVVSHAFLSVAFEHFVLFGVKSVSIVLVAFEMRPNVQEFGQGSLHLKVFEFAKSFDVVAFPVHVKVAT